MASINSALDCFTEAFVQAAGLAVGGRMDFLPTLAEVFTIAPISTIVCLIVAGGYYAGFRSRQGHIESQQAFIDYLQMTIHQDRRDR